MFDVTTTLDTIIDDGLLSLREAILAANAAPGADTIQLAAGTYQLTRSGANEDAGQTGDLDIRDAVTITRTPSTTGTVTVNGGGLDRVFHVVGTFNPLTGPVVTIAGITITNGATPSLVGGGSSGHGGGVLNEFGTLTLDNVTLRGNRTGDGSFAGNGGGVYTNNGTTTLESCIVTQNATGKGTIIGGNGGGVASLTSTTTIRNSIISDNRTGDGPVGNISAGDGGGVYSSSAELNRNGTLRIERSAITGNFVGTNGLGTGGGVITHDEKFSMVDTLVANNSAWEAGGVEVDIAREAVILRSTIRDNTATGNGGGGVHVNGGVLNIIDSSTISGNTSQSATGFSGGGGVFNQGLIQTIVNSTISGNTSGNVGGGIANQRFIGRIANVTIANNTAPNGGGIHHMLFANLTPEIGEIRNTLIGDNAAPTNPDFAQLGNVISATRNLVESPVGHTLVNGVNGNIVGLDPVLGPLSNNGDSSFSPLRGPMSTHALLAGSPAIDAGDPYNAPGSQLNDQRGQTRSTGAATDIGAFELQAPPPNRPPTAALFQFGTPEDTPLLNNLKGADPDNDPITYSVVAPPANGMVTITNAATGAFTYTPNLNYNGTDSFTYKVNDGKLDSNVATIFVTVAAVNDAPIAANDNYSVNEDNTLTIAAPGVLGNDTDVENNPLVTVLGTGPANGTLTLNANGSFTYRPRLNFNGTDTFTYQAKENFAAAPGLLSNVATVTITVNAVNDAPIPTPVVTNATTAEDTPLSGQLSARDPENDAFTFSLDIAPPNGIVTVNPDGAYTYSPNANFFGTDQFVFRVTDIFGASSQGAVSITVTPVNDAPVAANDSFSVDEDGALSLTVAPVTRLRMVSEPGDFVGGGLTYDFNALTATFKARPNFDNGVELSVDPPPLGSFWTLNFAAPNDVLLTPGTYLDAMRFPFQTAGKPGFDVSGDGRGSNTLTGRFVVYDVNRSADGTQILSFAAAFEQHSEGNPPALIGWSMFNTTFGAGGGVLANDSDLEGDLLLGAALVTGPANGTLAFRGDGTFDYTPNPNFHGTDTFTYRTNDGRADSNVATVTITVNSVNDAPTATPLSLATPEDTPVAVPLAGRDADNDPLTFVVVTPPQFGTVTFDKTGTAVYTPNPNFNGFDSFAYTASDGKAASAPATVQIDVSAVNDVPTAGVDSYATDEDTPLTVAVPGVLGNDADVDNDTLAAAVLAGPTKGILALAADGSFTYTPNANFNGTDSFTYTVSDGKGGTATGSVTIRVHAVNDAPSVQNAAVATNEDTPFDGALLGVDVDGDVLRYAVVAGPAKGAVTVNANGTYTYSPGPNFNGTDSFTFKANDGAADSNVGTVSIVVRAVNDLPVAAPLSLSTDEDVAVGGTMTAMDVDGDTLRFALVTSPSKGNLSFNPATGAFTYTPNANYNGTDSFTYRANDGTANGPAAIVALTVRPVADAPVVTPATFTIPENAANNAAVGTVVATDADGGMPTLAIVGGNTGGAFAIDPNTGAIRVANTAALDFETQPVFALAVRATDPTGLTGEATVTVRLSDVNENLRVRIDIEPEDRRNRINLRSDEDISVAIFSTADFDARTVDVGSLRFGRTGLEDSLVRDRQGRPKYDYKDVNGDGRLDLVVRFEVDETGFRVGDVRGFLTGRLKNGTAFSADDAVSVTRDRGGDDRDC